MDTKSNIQHILAGISLDTSADFEQTTKSHLTKYIGALLFQTVEAVMPTCEDALKAKSSNSNNGPKTPMAIAVKQVLAEVVRSGLVLRVSGAEIRMLIRKEPVAKTSSSQYSPLEDLMSGCWNF